MQDTPVIPFYLQSFTATTPGGTRPVSRFAKGDPVELSWDSNGTSFTLYAARDAAPLYSGTAKSFVVGGGRTDTTTFILAASVTGGPESGTPHPGYEAIFLYDALTVTISNPDVTPGSVTAGTLAVSGTSTLKGDATLGDTVVNGTLTATGAAHLNGGATAASLTVPGTSILQGDATLGNAVVNGTLTATAGAVSLGNAVVSGLTVLDSVAMMSPRGIGPGTFTASSDGLVVGVVSGPSNPGARSIAWIYGKTAGGIAVRATGGNMVNYQDSSHFQMSNNGNTFVMPVKKGEGCSVSVQQGNNDAPAPTWFYWVPFGRNASLQALSEDEAAALGLAPPEPAKTVMSPWPEPDLAIADLLDILAQLTGGPIPRESRERFTAAVRELVVHATP